MADQAVTAPNRFLKAFYMGVTVFVNLVVMLVVLRIDFPVPDTYEYQVWITFAESHRMLTACIYALSFLIPGAASSKISAKSLQSDMTEIERFKVGVLNSPLRCATISVAGWGFVFLSQIGCTVYVYLTTGVKVYASLKNSAMFTLLAWVFVFSCTFLILETVNRARIIPRFFPGYDEKADAGKDAGTASGNNLKAAKSKNAVKISAIKHVVKPSITFLFLMYYVGVAIFPVVVLLISNITEEQNSGLPVNWNLALIIAAFMIAGGALTVLLANLFRKPLKELTGAAEKISGGDYTGQVRVVSGDEIGRLGDTFNDMAASLAEKEFMKDVFGKIVTPDVRDHLLNEGTAGIALGGETMNVTILFCDIRGFTTLSEKMESAEVVQLLNYYFTAMSGCIIRNHGIINKYIGDAVMAIFGAPIKTGTHARDAYRAALEMRAALVDVNEEFARRGFPEIRFGIGIHTGAVLAGNIGSAERMEYTVIGDSVNVASRIEGLCKEHRRDLLLSESTVNALGITATDTALPRPTFLCDSPIRGKEATVGIYCVE